jgi:flavin-dependent dehydrogenase
MTMRADLDALLARQAMEAGARLVESCPVKNVTMSDEAVEISTSRGNFRAKFIIAADGVHSVTAKSLGWSALPLLAPALEYEVHLSPEDFSRFNKIPRFDFNAIDAGYAWVFPKRAHLSVGILSTRRVCTNLQTKLFDYMELLGITRIQSIERHGYLIPLAPRREPLARGRALLVGDAAGLADPITAEGISFAIESGQIAAAALAECRLDAKTVSGRYQFIMEEKILGELRAGRRLAYFLYNLPRLRYWAFRFRGQRLSDFVADVVMGKRTYRSALKNPLSYLKMIGLSRVGRREV